MARSRAASTNVVDRASRADARGRARARTRARSETFVAFDRSSSVTRARDRRGPRGEDGKGTIPTFPRRRHDDDRDLRDDERAIDDADEGGERTNEIVRAVWRRREG